MLVKVSKYIADELVKNGISDVFTVTGGGAMHLNDSFGHHEKLNCIYNHHEQACAIAAESYTRLTRKLALVCVTSGPGGTNSLTGVLGAWLDSIPMIIISGQVKRETTIWSTKVPLRQLGDQEYNIVPSVSPMTKYAKMIVDPNEIAYHLEKALFLCKSGRGGPVWLDITLDIQAAQIDPDKLIHFDPSELADLAVPKMSLEESKVIIDKISNAKRPVIIAGSAIRLSGAHDTFVQLIDKLNIPVVTAWNAHDNLWNDHPLYCGRPSTLGTRGGNFVVENSDLILSLGCRLNIRQISYNYKSFAPKAYKIIVDIDQAELDKPTLSPDMKVHADVADFMDNLLQASYDNRIYEHQMWLQWCRKTDARYPVDLPSYYQKNKPLNPYVFMRQLFQELDADDVIVASNGSACVCSFQAAYIKKGQRLYTNSGCASMGYGLPAAFGASVAQKGSRVICLEGDGSLQMNIQELQTIRHHHSNLKLFVLNNNGYHSIRQTQTNLFNPPLVGVCADNGISFPELEKIAMAYGLSYFCVDEVNQINDSIRKVLSISGPVMCEVILDSTQFFSPKLSSKVLPDGSIVSPSIDDMFPFLDDEEYLSNKLQ